MSQQKLSDGELVLWIRNPDSREAGFRHLAQAYQRVLFKTIIRLVMNVEDAEDILQETFMKIYKNIDQLSDPGKLRSWLIKTANNEALMFLRKERIRSQMRFEKFDQIVAKKLQNNSILSENEILYNFHKALLTLAPKQRAIFNLRYYEEMPFNEIAQVMGNSAGACKAAYHQSVKKIERCLKQE
jgi:RNA polymerase sigma factor (sigma-70 family)